MNQTPTVSVAPDELQSAQPDGSGQLRVTVNGEETLAASNSLQALLAMMGYDESTVATAVNGDFVASASRAGYVLKPGDQIEVLAPRQGG